MNQLSKRPLSDRTGDAAVTILYSAMIVVGLVPFIAHIWRTVATDWVAMLLLGLFFFPIGWIHGAGVILGLW